MSAVFQTVMRDIHDTLCDVYNADAAIVVPGGGTYAMEAVARQFAVDKQVTVIRNGWFSYRWSQIFQAGALVAKETVLKARPSGNALGSPFAPVPIDAAVAHIENERPDLVFAPHVETASGIILPDDYIAALAKAVHDVGGMLVLDCIASGCVWVDMRALGVDILISAPQKGWSAQPCAGLVMMNAQAAERCAENQSNSFAVDLGKWQSIMQAYTNGGHAYHATLPTDALRVFRDTMLETKSYGFEKLKNAQIDLGARVRKLLAERGVKSVAADGFAAPGVVVSFTDDADIQTGKKFAERGMQIAAGVPLQCDEGPDYRSFRLGLFGLDKLYDVERTVQRLTDVLDQVLPKT